MRINLPPGYLIPSMQESFEDLVVRPDRPVIPKEFRVRKGTIWNIQFTRGSDQRPFLGIVHANAAVVLARADDRGCACLTLPIAGKSLV
jgi:hypothetical protein